MYGVEFPEEIYTYRTLHDYFESTLEKVASRLTQHKKLVILLDGLSHLSSESDAQNLSWMPESWPKHVHVVMTTDTADQLSMRNLKNHVDRIVRDQKLDRKVVDNCFWSIDALTIDEIDAMIDNELRRASRTLTAQQRTVRDAFIDLTPTFCLQFVTSIQLIPKCFI